MCGRFALNENPKKLAEHFHLFGEVEFKPSWNIAPYGSIYSITADNQEQRHLSRMHWGFVPHWSDDPNKFKLNCAKGETVAEKPLFKTAFRSRRCIIPVSGFYEWIVINKLKYPWYISLKSGAPMAMAGIWETWKPKVGAAIDTCSIITTGPNELMRPIHDRMPVILDADQWETWLSPNEKQPDHLLPMLHPYDAGAMQAWQVTREANKTGDRDDAGLIEPFYLNIGHNDIHTT
jgi:putative SOS response-associated peptidase YedK